MLNTFLKGTEYEKMIEELAIKEKTSIEKMIERAKNPNQDFFDLIPMKKQMVKDKIERK